MLRPATVAAAFLIAAIVATATAQTSAQAPQSPPVFRGGVDVVQLDVSVLDENRQPVRGLTASDFTVIERGATQPIVSFGAVDLPGRPVDSAAWVGDVAPDVTTNHQNAQRVVVILMDDFNTSFDPMHTKRAKTIGHAVIDGLGPSDLAAVVYVVSRRQGQEFTSDHARLRAAVDRFAPSGLAGPRPSAPYAASSNPTLVPMVGASGACSGGRCIPDAMQNTADVLRGYPGWRKTFVFVSPFTPRFSADSIATVGDIGTWSAVFDAMQEANMTVYQFDPRGLEVGSDITEDLGMFADATGGRTTKHTNAPEAGVPQMFRENSSYYVLGIQPLNLMRNGRFRPIEVRVNRPGVTVRTRAGYFAPRDGRPPRPSNRAEPSAAQRAIAGALPSGELPMSLTVAPLAGESARKSTVRVIAGFTPLGLPADGEEVDVLVTAFRDDWKEMGTVTQKVRVTASRGQAGPPQIDIPVQLELQPGRYEIRAALSRSRTGQAGSAYASVVVPDFAQEPLVLSGILIEHGRPVAAAERAGEMATVPFTTVRRFAPSDRVAAVMSVHQGGRRPVVSTEVEMRIIDIDNRVRASRRVTLDPALFNPDRAADLRFELPLTGLEPGEYLVAIEATTVHGHTLRHVRVQVR
jgi:VWFA-related protein